MKMMNRISVGAALLFSLASASMAAQSTGDMGLGFMIGQPSGVSGKYWLNSTAAIDFGAGYHFDDDFAVHTDLLYHLPYMLNVPEGRMPFFIGVGGRVLLGDDSQFGIRIPIGASYFLPNDPIELFAELVPVIKLTSGVGGRLDGAVGVRFYFNFFR